MELPRRWGGGRPFVSLVIIQLDRRSAAGNRLRCPPFLLSFASDFRSGASASAASWSPRTANRLAFQQRQGLTGRADSGLAASERSGRLCAPPPKDCSTEEYAAHSSNREGAPGPRLEWRPFWYRSGAPLGPTSPNAPNEDTCYVLCS